MRPMRSLSLFEAALRMVGKARAEAPATALVFRKSRREVSDLLFMLSWSVNPVHFWTSYFSRCFNIFTSLLNIKGISLVRGARRGKGKAVELVGSSLSASGGWDGVSIQAAVKFHQIQR